MLTQAEARAVARYVKMTPRKLRLVVGLIRGKHVKEALQILKFVPKHGAKIVEKVIKSAVANAENEPYKMDTDNLYISSAMVDQGPVLKRWIPRAQGRASAIRKRMSHVTIKVREKDEPVAPKKGARDAEAKVQPRRGQALPKLKTRAKAVETGHAKHGAIKSKQPHLQRDLRPAKTKSNIGGKKKEA